MTDGDVCACGHARDWHSHGGEGDCEHDGACLCQVFTIAEPSFSRPRSYTPEFEIHASSKAIAAFIAQARERSAAILNEIGWLEALYSRRLAEATRTHSASEDRGGEPSAAADTAAHAEHGGRRLPDHLPGFCGDRLVPNSAPCCRPEGHGGLHVPITHPDAVSHMREDWRLPELPYPLSPLASRRVEP